MIFPTLAAGRCGYVNLDYHYANYWLAERNMGMPKRKSPMLDADTCREMVNRMHHLRELAWSHGGWLEDRSRLWRGSYLQKEKKFLHLGIDFNAPFGTPVACDHYGIVMRVDNDHPEPGGWGPRVMIMLDRIQIVLIFAHLDPSVLTTLKAGDAVEPGKPFASVGSSLENGQWYPHVHVQAMHNHSYWFYESHLGLLDGYGRTNDAAALAAEFPDPLNYVRLYD